MQAINLIWYSFCDISLSPAKSYISIPAPLHNLKAIVNRVATSEARETLFQTAGILQGHHVHLVLDVEILLLKHVVYFLEIKFIKYVLFRSNLCLNEVAVFL